MRYDALSRFGDVAHFGACGTLPFYYGPRGIRYLLGSFLSFLLDQNRYGIPTPA